HDHDARVGQPDTCDGQALFLAAGQAVPPLAHDRVVAVGELHDPVVDVRRPGGFPDLRHGGGGTAVTDVGQDAVVEEVALLGHEAAGGGQRCLEDVPGFD